MATKDLKMPFLTISFVNIILEYLSDAVCFSSADMASLILN